MGEEKYASFINKFLSILDRKIRSFILAEKILEFALEEVSDFLEDIVKESFRGNKITLEILFSLVDLLESIYDKDLSKRVHDKIRNIATTNVTLKNLLHPPPPHKFLKKGEIEITDVKMDYLPLGVKRSMAKKMDVFLLRRMVFEKDPIVIKHLLSNPVVSEKDVLKISSIRPTTQAVIKTIYESSKWINYYSVKESIIKNPYTPFRIALLLLFYMKIQELEAISKDETLHPELRYEAKKIILIRKTKTD
ncbi:MAG: hypothetical protein N2202_06550 [Proteobacteria bacterium]|nr:hypothetical protein [Pseudomonadota bacterium]